MSKFHLPSIEEEVLKQWEEKGILRQVMDKPAPAGNFVFFEGPPTANGKPGIHHVLARSFKDVVMRYRVMRGYHIDRKAGWDTHGLPVELEVEKQLGFKNKNDIENYGIAAFNAKCRESVWKYLDLWQKITRRVGFWVDMEDPYVTYKNDYVESLWWVMKQIESRGFLYRGYRITPHCPRCVTSLSSHELAQGYKDVDDQSIFVKFKVAGEANRFFLVWTTTPWTLPGNDALAVGADVDYAEVKLKATGEQLILAKARLSVLDGEYEIIKEMSGADLVGMAYEPLYATAAAFTPENESDRVGNAYKVYSAGFVSTTDGSGIVHIAPAFGEDDARLGEANRLPTLLTVDSTGMMLSDAPGKGRFVKSADEDVKADLTARGLLYKSETYRHAYPFCWRCSTPLLYYAKSSWYIRMSDLREKLQSNNAQINWVPEHVKEGRFGEWLREVKDWAISRERYWGTPLPIWQCGCGEREVIGGLEELKQKGAPRNRYFLLRHGDAEHIAAGVVSCWPEKKEYNLTDKGREQVREAAARLKELGAEIVISSDLLRAKQTAEIVAAELGVSVAYDERLREGNFGEFNGLTIEEFHAKAGKAIERMDKGPTGGESLREVRRRAVAFIKEMETKFEGKKIVVVSHGDPLWMVTSGFAGLDDAATAATTYNKVGTFIELALENLPYDEEGKVDPHRPFIDEVKLRCRHCGGDMRRVSEVADCWFDSGAMPFAQWHYPFENAERIDTGRNFPADYISEGMDQTRGWFYTLLAVSTLLGKEVPPYKNCVALGLVLDGKGQKMSKSKGNVVDPFLMMDKFGADAVRYYFFTVNQPGEAKLFDEKSLDEVTKKVFLILWNVLTFWKTYASGAAKTAAPVSDKMLDQWVLAELAELNRKMTAELDAYDMVSAGRRLGDFVNVLSTWYLRRSRDRFKSEDVAEKAAAVDTLGYVLLTLAKLMAPFTPFLSEALYKEVGGDKESIHLEEWPEAAAVNRDSDVLRDKMKFVREAASAGQEKRATSGIGVRQALALATVSAPQEFEAWMLAIVAEELNVEKTEWKKGEIFAVELDTVITPELKRKGAAREMVRFVNSLRKAAGLTVGDRIKLHYETGSDFWKQVMVEHGERLRGDVLGESLTEGRLETANATEIEVDGEKIWCGF